jgi:hypothetical protein
MNTIGCLEQVSFGYQSLLALHEEIRSEPCAAGHPVVENTLSVNAPSLVIHLSTNYLNIIPHLRHHRQRQQSCACGPSLGLSGRPLRRRLRLQRRQHGHAS